MPNQTPSSLTLLAVALATSLACASGGSRPPEASASTTGGGDGKTMDQLFVGKFPGVDVQPGPNGGLSIRIRGQATFYGSNEPLYVVDGVPIEAERGGIVFLSPNDISKIEVLKNAADIGVYGLRGANGVILITTRRPGKKPPT
jgi:TonB-dependent SusC/RagA subfamily outer membrane receptor